MNTLKLIENLELYVSKSSLLEALNKYLERLEQKSDAIEDLKVIVRSMRKNRDTLLPIEHPRSSWGTAYNYLIGNALEEDIGGNQNLIEALKTLAPIAVAAKGLQERPMENITRKINKYVDPLKIALLEYKYSQGKSICTEMAPDIYKFVQGATLEDLGYICLVEEYLAKEFQESDRTDKEVKILLALAGARAFTKILDAYHALLLDKVLRIAELFGILAGIITYDERKVIVISKLLETELLSLLSTESVSAHTTAMEIAEKTNKNKIGIHTLLRKPSSWTLFKSLVKDWIWPIFVVIATILTILGIGIFTFGIDFSTMMPYAAAFIAGGFISGAVVTRYSVKIISEIIKILKSIKIAKK